MARHCDWGDEKAQSRIKVPFELTYPEQKKALVEIWSSLKEVGLGLPDLAQILKQHESGWVQEMFPPSRPSTVRLFRKYSTAVAASFGVISADDVDAGGYEEVDLNSELISNPDRTIFLKVVGNSMINDGIYPNSLLIVEARDNGSKAWLEPRNGQRVIALVDETDLTVKRFCKFEDGYYLVPQNRKNRDYQPLRVGEADDNSGGRKVEILGIVKSVTRTFS